MLVKIRLKTAKTSKSDKIHYGQILSVEQIMPHCIFNFKVMSKCK